ncbi:hypothetical protein WP8S17C03_11440 [Metapseudomonas otitidis]|uniref:Gp5/Type VI secretion system Vgr protein OB-fold domain-containing protein n=1 Tax=Metapseudomonas otitidis TaxID=319939 RepID=A0A6S5RQ40_9GAMM|nr:hypothetical protein [Pseudomonas otitidis]BBT15095.1 hypothetical protein WP8S17C03_11440 [Pseudomonas otitidis]
MEDAIRRAVERQFPELTGGYHLPRLGRVIAVPDAPDAPGLCDDFRPRFGVDVEVLRPDGEPDPDLPILHSLPLPAPNGGQEAGFFGFPEEGATVVVCFAYGLPHKPYIAQILPHGLSLPKVSKGDQLWQHSEASQQRVDSDGNWIRQTDGQIRDQAVEREVEALENTEHYQITTVDVDDHSTETVGGVKKLQALGALKLLSGGSASLAAVGDLHQATGRDLNLVVGQKLNTTVGGDMTEAIVGIRRSIAAQTWLGSPGVNVLQVLLDLIELVEQMNANIASHVHASSPPPTNAVVFSEAAGTAGQLCGKLKPITA